MGFGNYWIEIGCVFLTLISMVTKKGASAQLKGSQFLTFTCPLQKIKFG
jgi:hypothetical protein